MMQTGAVTTENEHAANPKQPRERELALEHDGIRKVAEEAAKDRERQKVVLGGMVLIAGMLIISILLILLIAMWGYRLRRQLRESRKGPTRVAGGDFWFLKPKANPSNGDSIDGDDNANESGNVPPPHLPPPAEPS